jgi:hypothetical protein
MKDNSLSYYVQNFFYRISFPGEDTEIILSPLIVTHLDCCLDSSNPKAISCPSWN